MSLAYASLEDAWNDPVSNPGSSSKKTKKKKTPAVCSLYAQSTSAKKEMDEDFMSFYDDMEISSYQRKDTTKPYDKFNVQPIESIHPEMSAPYEPYSSGDVIEEEEASLRPAPLPMPRNVERVEYRNPRTLDVVERFQDTPVLRETHMTAPMMMDFGLYILSGIFLILIMEQILQLGIRLR